MWERRFHCCVAKLIVTNLQPSRARALTDAGAVLCAKENVLVCDWESRLSANMRRAFCWLLMSSWAIVLGAKIFDLLVLGCAWGANPPKSFDFLPYGKAFPIDPGNFFQPLSALILLSGIACLATGWKSPARPLLLISMGSFIVIWILTPTVFWPMIGELWEIHRGRLSRTDAESLALVHRWFVWDSGRIGLIGIGFVYSVRALCSISGPNAKST